MCLTNSNRCYNCDPQDKTKCIMCTSGFVMTANGKCESIISINEEKEAKLKEENETELLHIENKNNLAASGITLKSLLSAFLLLLTFF